MKTWGSILLLLLVISVVLNINFFIKPNIVLNEKKSDNSQKIMQNPQNSIENPLYRLQLYANYEPKELASPDDRIQEHDIVANENKVGIEIQNSRIVRFADTHSMEPAISATANGIEILPKSADDIKIGDIISYTPKLSDKQIIHRVINISTDDLGIYYTLKGDNIPFDDPEKVRFEQVRYILVGILY